MMEAIDQSSYLMNSPFSSSNQESLYDHQNRNESKSMKMNIKSVDNFSDDYSLDEKLEDSTLQHFLTTDVIDSLQCTSKESMFPELANEQNSDHFLSAFGSTNSTFSQLTDLSFVDEILNDLNSNLEFLCQDIKPSIDRPTSKQAVSSPRVQTSLNASFNSTQPRTFETPFNPRETNDQKFIQRSFFRNSSPIRATFPSKELNPPPIGIVEPVIKSEQSKLNDSKLSKLTTESPNLHRLLSSESLKCKHKPVQSLIVEPSIKESTPQTVPSAMSSKTYQELVTPTLKRKREDESTEDKWKVIQKFMTEPEPEPLVKRTRHDSGGSGHTSEDDVEDNEFNTENNDDDSDDDDYSDIDADLVGMSPSQFESLIDTGKKQKQYFWQYNVQSKGPKGTRLKLAVEPQLDPHVLKNFEDPVFDECNTAVAGIRHGGKARKGDGNEVTPNPKKLFMIGHQLKRLNSQINACQLGSDVPVEKRNQSKKEKNKLASRACRLKKKAQHEANKIKLFGLEKEHTNLNNVLRGILPLLKEKAKVILNKNDKTKMEVSQENPLTSVLESHIQTNLKDMIAGNTIDYVNGVILRVEKGDMNGGLPTKNRKT